jgi:hypothetical protein
MLLQIYNMFSKETNFHRKIFQYDCKYFKLIISSFKK